jgi:3'(2'), 5'-bisphosphate nucleotidase
MLQKEHMQQYLETAIKAAIMAGKTISEIYASGFTVDYKDDCSPLTTADLAANKIIKSQLAPTALPFLSEEDESVNYSIRKHWDRYWLVDPLDGTKEFVMKNGEFTVNIALIDHGTPILGVIYAPVPDLLYYAGIHFGAFRMKDTVKVLNDKNNINEIIELSDQLPRDHSKRPYTVVASRSHLNAPTRQFIDRLAKEHQDMQIITKGSSLKLCAIAEGSADMYPRFGPTMEWDTAAGHAIVIVSGGHVKQAGSSTPLVYNKPDLMNPDFISFR